MAIRFDQDFNKEIKRAVDKFNKKLKRAQSRGLKYLPSKQSIKELKEEFGTQSATRRELRYRLKELEKFNLKTASETEELYTGEKTSLYNLMIAKRRRARLLRLNKKQIREQEKLAKPEYIFSRSKLNKLKNIRESLLKPIQKSRDRLRSINALFNKEYSSKRLDTFHENFFDIMDKQAEFIGYDQEKYQIIKDKLSKVDSETLLKMTNNPRFHAFLDRYDKNGDYNDYDSEVLDYMFDDLYDNIDNLINEYTFEDYEIL